MDDITLLYTTWPEADTAERAARTVVEEGLAACVNILGSGVSIYRWQGSIERAAETVMILKTGMARAPALRERLCALHPYELPAIVALTAEKAASHRPFLSWIASETSSAS